MKKFITDIKKYLSYSVYAAKAELKSEVANSHLNWVWWVLEPFCMMLVYALIFGNFFNAREPFFSAYIFIGNIMWNFFNVMIKGSIKLVKKNKAIVTKVYIPKYILVQSNEFVYAFKLLIGLGITVALMIYNQVTVSLRVLWIIPVFLCMFLITFGLANIVMHFGVYVEDLSNIMNIVLRLMFYMTGIFYNIETRAGKYGPFLSKYNPMAFLINSARKCLLYNTTPDLVILGFWFVLGIIFTIIGVAIIQKNENSYAKAI